MTREEKINTLRTIIQECEEYQWQRKETLFEIIKDLDQEPVLDKIRTEIKDWQTDIHDNEYDAEKHDFVFERIYEIIDGYMAEGSEK